MNARNPVALVEKTSQTGVDRAKTALFSLYARHPEVFRDTETRVRSFCLKVSAAWIGAEGGHSEFNQRTPRRYLSRKASAPRDGLESSATFVNRYPRRPHYGQEGALTTVPTISSPVLALQKL